MSSESSRDRSKTALLLIRIQKIQTKCDVCIMATEVTSTEKFEGCQHYKRNCQLVSPCCGKLYACRFCHDDKESHKLNRKEVTEVKCMNCLQMQSCSQVCKLCNQVLGSYYCEICRLYDNEDKKQFHCDKCGICRIGGRSNFFHCFKCDTCLSVKTQNSHKCIEKVSRANCPVCLEDLHSSRIVCHVPPCGHFVHSTCFKEMLETGNYACPICAESMIEMETVWGHLDEEIASTPMPAEYANFKVRILCRDCHKKSEVLFHVLGLKCQLCGSYNTCRTGNENKPLDVDTS